MIKYQEIYIRTVKSIDKHLKANCAQLHEPDKRILYKFTELLPRGIVENIQTDYHTVGWCTNYIVPGYTDLVDTETNIFGILVFFLPEKEL